MMDASNGNIVALHDYLPFGEEISGSPVRPSTLYGGTDNPRQKFTGKERDSETGLDFFGARYFSGPQGRFASPDSGPYIWRDPQTLNRYAYTRNNPLKFVDPTGKYFVVASEMREQVKQYISTMLRSPQGAATINAIAASSKPVSYNLGSLARVQSGNNLSGTAGSTVVVPGNQPGQIGGANVTLDNNNISFISQKTGSTNFSVGLKAFAHEDQHVTDMLRANTFQGAAAAGASGDAPSRPGALDTSGGTAESRALQIMGDLGDAGQDYLPSPRWDSAAEAILQQGSLQELGDFLSSIAQSVTQSVSQTLCGKLLAQ